PVATRSPNPYGGAIATDYSGVGVGVQTPTPRHVLFLNWRDTTNPDGGGSEVYVERIAGELVAGGHRATIFCAAHGDAPTKETTPTGVRIIRRGGRHTVYVRAA